MTSRSTFIEPPSGGERRSVHINPKFSTSPPSSKVLLNPKFGNVHVNPNFTGRALPPIPHINPEFIPLDPSKATSYRESIQKAVDSSKMKLRKEEKVLFIDPDTVKLRDKTQKENRTPPSSSFKKIGNRKLIRIRRKSLLGKEAASSPKTPKLSSSSSFKKIGTRKLIRIRSKKDSPSASNLKGKSPILVYKVKKPNKIIKTTPKKKGSSFSSKFTMSSASKKSASPRKTPFSKMLNPFKLDRRRRSKNSLSKKTPSPLAKKSSASSLAKDTSPNRTHKKVIGEETYLVTTTSIKKVPPPPKPARQTAPTPVRPSLISVQGVKYNVSDNGRKLCRVESGGTASTTTTNFGVSKKLFLEGEEYVEDEPGVLVRSRNSMTRQSITSYRNRSINTIIKSQTRSKQYCMFFNKFGKCNKREKGVCPYIHDPEKVAVCRRFLQGNCVNEKCLLSHEVAPEKMPSCKFFLEGICVRDNCPYRHIKVNSTAELCTEFIKGFCSEAENCKKQHAYICQEFVTTGKCSKNDECRFPHPQCSAQIMTPQKVKKVAPIKPKRKSLGNTPMTAQGKKARLRYYEDGCEEENIETESKSRESKENEQDELHTNEYVIRRKRLLRKIELAKQGWTGVARVENIQVDLDDSGPYEEIDDEPSRPPVGNLPSFISLSKYDTSEGEEEEGIPDQKQLTAKDDNYEERLI